MISYIKYWFQHYIYWLLFFLAFRIALLLFIKPFDGNFTFTDFLLVISKGYQLDISVASYLFIVPFFLMLINIIKPTRHLIYSLKTYHLIISIALIILSISNIVIFKYWGTLINNRALAYFTQPGELLASASSTLIFAVPVVFIILVFTATKTYNRFVLRFVNLNIGNKKTHLAGIIIILVLSGIGIRGGLQEIPVNESNAVFSNNSQLNQIAINPMWYLGHNLHQSGMRNRNPYQFVDNDTANTITDKLLIKNNSESKDLFHYTKKPNIVLILLESWTADVIKELDGLDNVTPGFHMLCKNGLLFSNIYSSGFRTDQALVSVLSGFPSQPNVSIIRYPSKSVHLPSMPLLLQQNGYTNSFYYGGDLAFANMNNYIINSGFSKIVSENDFDSKDKNSKWGAHDEFIFEKQLSDLNNSITPFFSTLLTLSTHEPFEVPVQTPFVGKSESEQFKKAAWYTDQCLLNYFNKAKRTTWYNNTIFILMADHGHRLPMERDYFDSRARQIPFLIVSPLLKEEFRGTKINTLANQHDLPATLLNILGIPDDQFKWSVNILNKSRNNYVYLSYDNSIVWITDSTSNFIPLQEGISANQDATERNSTVAKAFLQKLYQTFLDY